MHWLDEDHGYFSGIETFHRTTNGGKTLEDITFGDITNEFETVFFVDEMLGYVGAFNATSTPYLTVYKTLDGGDTWVITSLNLVGSIIHNFDFVAEDNGCIYWIWTKLGFPKILVK